MRAAPGASLGAQPPPTPGTRLRAGPGPGPAFLKNRAQSNHAGWGSCSLTGGARRMRGPPCWSPTSWPWNAGVASPAGCPLGQGCPQASPSSCSGASTPSASRGPGAIFNSAELLVLKVDRAPGPGSRGWRRGRAESRESLTAAFLLPPLPGTRLSAGTGHSRPQGENSIPPHKPEVHGGHADTPTVRHMPRTPTHECIRVHTQCPGACSATYQAHRGSGRKRKHTCTST